MPGYYDEITGDWVDTGDDYGYNPLDDTSGTGGIDDWSYLNGVWTDPSGQPWDTTDTSLDEDSLKAFYDAGGTSSMLSKLGSGIFNRLKSAYTNKDGSTNWKAIAATAGGLAGLYGAMSNKSQPTGFQGKIPSYTAVREQTPGTYDPNRRPGSAGQQYFTDTKYVKEGEDVAAARTAAKEEAAGIAALNAANPARQARPSATQEAVERGEESAAVQEREPASSVAERLPVSQYSHGGITMLARGGNPRYLAGQTDGMGDRIPANIDGKQRAALSHGEFVIPADVVSHLGNGNSEAGAKRLYAMMDRIRQARTGTKRQGKKINPDKFLAA